MAVAIAIMVTGRELLIFTGEIKSPDDKMDLSRLRMACFSTVKGRHTLCTTDFHK